MEALSIFAIAISVLTLIFSYYSVSIKFRKELADNNTAICERVKSLEVKTELFWKCVEGGVVNMLKSYPTNIHKDVLLDKMIHNELTLDDAQQLRTILTEEMKVDDKGHALAHILALGRLEQIIFDLLPRGKPC
jgi:hypothetical protein